nr:hypothetical protein [Tanacetum cinerariifolium]
MPTPTFAKTHNLIAYLAKPSESKGFKHIVDFLNGSSVSYALTASPTIRTSCIKQFWTTAKVKTINDEVRIQALIDEKKVNIKESSIHHTLSTMESTIICLATTQKLNFSRYILLSLVKNIEDGVPFFMFPRIKKLEGRVDKLEEENWVLKDLNIVHSKVDIAAPIVEKEKSFKQGRIITDIDEDVEINLEEAQAKPYRMDLEHPEKVLSMQDVDDEEPVEVEKVLEVVTVSKLITKVVTTARATTTAEATKVGVPRRRRGVVIQDPEETTSTVVVHSEVQSKEKGKEEVNEEVTEPEKEVEVEGHKKGESLEKEITKKQKMDEEAEELKNHLQIVSNDDDDDVYTEATPLASKIPIVDYKIHLERNKPYFKIIRANGNHMLFLSFSTLLNNFDREDLESLWKLVKEKFKKTEPKNYTNDYLLKTLKKMFEQPDVKAIVWRDQKGRYGLAKIRSWKLFESCGVHCIPFSTTQMFLLVEKRYPLIHFTLEQMLNNVRLEVEEESEMS